VKTFWIVVSGLCGVTAILLFVRNDYDKAFIAATLGVVAWFLNYRTRLRETFDKDETETSADAEADAETDTDS
jgi:hypothetical protein